MKHKVLLFFVSFALVPTVCSYAQINCASTTQTKLICEFPVSSTQSNFTLFGPAANNAANSVASTINASTATQLTQLPIPSASIGVVSLRQKGQEATAPFDNLGPILTDRPDTVGKGHIYLGFSYQHFGFNAVDGVGLGALPVSFVTSVLLTSTDQRTEYGTETNNVNFKLDQEVGIATAGLTKSTDVSIVVPFNSVALHVTTSNIQAFTFDSAAPNNNNQPTYQNTVPLGSVAPIYSNGTANGVGDITLILKQQVLGGEGSRTAVAAGASARFPTGDSLNLLGSGAFGGNVFGLFEYRARVAPHLKLSYQWNNKSQLVNLSAPPSRLPGGLQFATGADVKILRTLGASFDLLGSQFVNTPSFALNTSTICQTQPSNTTTVPCYQPPSATNGGTGISSSFTAVSTFNSTYTVVNFSAGLKWTPIRHFLVYANMTKQVNNVGLRSNIVPLVGIAFKR